METKRQGDANVQEFTKLKEKKEEKITTCHFTDENKENCKPVEISTSVKEQQLMSQEVKSLVFDKEGIKASEVRKKIEVYEKKSTEDDELEKENLEEKD